MKKCSVLALFSLILAVGSGGVYAAGQTAPPSMKADFEMRKNIVWTVEGLYQLGKSKDRALKLTSAQAKKILPLYQELIAKKIIQLKLEDDQDEKRGGPPPGSFDEPKGGPPAAPGGGDPRQQERRMQDRAGLVTFGNAKMEAINRLLTKKQIEFIDNWDFKAEKYGFSNFPNRPGGQGKFDAPPSGDGPSGNNDASGEHKMPRPDRDSRPINSKLEAGRKLLVKLNQDVLNMLKNYK